MPKNISPIDVKYQKNRWLGKPTTAERTTPDGVGRYRHYKNGSIYWHPKTGAHEVHGLIRRKWRALGWERSFLGYPTTDETVTPDGVGRFNHFQGGSIYWHPKTGAHEVHGNIRRKWQQLGWERSFLGYPTTDETATPDGVGRFNHFQGGSIYWHPRTGAHEVHGNIRRKWQQLGWERGVLGYPVTDETTTSDGVGRFSHFQSGSIYWHPETGVHEVHGLIWEKWKTLGRERSFLGYPTTDETATVGNKGRVNHFQGGSIYWTPQQGAYETDQPILAYYHILGGAQSFLGQPLTNHDEDVKRDVKMRRFEGGAIYWSPQIGPHEVHGEIYVRYLYLEAGKGILGLPLSDEQPVKGGRKSEFQYGTIYWSSRSGAHEVHGAIRRLYKELDGPTGFLGFPTSDESDILNRNGQPSGGKVSRFQHGTIYWSPHTGAFEVHGAIRELYEKSLGGPLGALGYPLTNETQLPGPQDIRYNNFQNGIIVWQPGKGARAVTDLELYLGWVKAGKIDDGYDWLSKDRSAELITYTTVVANGRILESDKRRPGGHSGDSYDIHTSYRIPRIQANTRVYFKIRVKDYDKASKDDYLATLEQTFDIRTFWGMDAAANGVYTDQPATDKGGDAPHLDTITFDYRISKPSWLPSRLNFRKQAWWQFDNFDTPQLSRQLYANTFRDVEVTGSTWERILHPFDSLYYELAYKKIAANGNCFGMALEGQYALVGRSVLAEPIHQYPNKAGIPQLINMKHGYQLGAEHIRWAISRLTNLDAIRPLNIFKRVEAQLRQGDRPIVSMFTLERFSGHSVLAYGTRRGRSGSPHCIYVADPNVPWGEAPRTNPSVIEIYPNDTFKFVSNGRIRYQSATIVGGLLPGTVMYDTPFHVVAGQPRTPFWEILQSVITLVGGLIILAGDAETEELQGDGASLHVTNGAGRGIVPNGIPNLARIPFLDYQGQAPELYARRGLLPSQLRVTVRGTDQTAAASSHRNNFRFGMRTARNEVVLDSPLGQGSHDQIELTATGSPQPMVTVTSQEPAKLAQVRYSVLDQQGRDGWGIEMELGVAAGAPARVSAASDGLGILVENAGPEQPRQMRFVTVEHGRPKQSVLTLPAEATQGAIRLQPEDLASPHGNLIIDRLDSFGGGALKRFIEQMRPDGR